MQVIELRERLVEMFSQEFDVSPVAGGANNRGFRATNSQYDFFIKAFNPQLPNALYKLNNEYAFSEYLDKQQIENIAKPVAKNEEHCFAVYHFIEGNKVNQLDQHDIDQALAFLIAINSSQTDVCTFQNNASDACFSLLDFYALVASRLNRLHKITNQPPELHAILNAITQDSKKIKNIITELNAITLPSMLSPSDFGFHNALLKADQWYFIDFEYAGYDSSWKCLADFISQPQIPVPEQQVRDCLVHPLFERIPAHAEAFLAAFELTQLKWCLIMLNEFLPEMSQRRAFAKPEFCLKQAKNQKLEQCHHYYNAIQGRCSFLSNLMSELSL